MRIQKCRVCGEKNLQSIMNLGNMALTGVFPKPNEKVPEAPIELLRCTGSCGLVQLADSYDPTEMYGDNYGYRSGLNSSMVRHLREVVLKIEKTISFAIGDLVIDIGSNDGTTLSMFPEQVQRLGVDPTGNKFRKYYRPGIELIPDFFSAGRVIQAIGNKRAKVITSFSMFYDLEDPVSFANQVSSVLANDGIWVMEQSYLPTMLRMNTFDTICHEHLEYYGLRQIQWIAANAGLEVIDVEENDTNGGSFLVTLAKMGAYPVKQEVAVMHNREFTEGYGEPLVYEAFKQRSASAVSALRNFLKYAKQEGLKVNGLGASTKGNVLLQSIPDIKDLINVIGDVNPDKYGHVTPGTKIPIVSEDEALADNPDLLLVLPWHFKAAFMKNLKFAGRKLLFPLPQLEVVRF